MDSDLKAYEAEVRAMMNEDLILAFNRISEKMGMAQECGDFKRISELCPRWLAQSAELLRRLNPQPVDREALAQMLGGNDVTMLGMMRVFTNQVADLIDQNQIPREGA